MSERGPFIIGADEAQQLLGRPGVSFVDGSWYLPQHNRDGRAEYQEARIPGAVFLDIDVVRDASVDLPHMLPSPADFAAAVGALGISHEDHIICYDGPGLFSAARIWWMLRVLGASNVQILDGGFDRWRQEGRSVESGPPRPHAPAVFKAKLDQSRIRTIGDIRANLKSGEAVILDARPFDRYAGQAPEPRPGLRSGHIPGSRSLPFNRLVEGGSLKPLPELAGIMREFAADSDREVITSCGSGVTAAIITLALESLGHRRNALYDGSWAEWGKADNAPVARWEDENPLK